MQPDPSGKDIVILGGSFAGVSVAHYLLKHVVPQLSREHGYRVVLVSASSQAICRPACPRAMISEKMFPQVKLFVDLADAFEQYPETIVRFVHGTATKLDHQGRNVTVQSANATSTEVLTFDTLVLATGASTPSPLHGLNGDSEKLRRSWSVFREALSNAKTIVVAGAGPTGVETAGELGEYLNGAPSRLTWSSVATPKVHITLVAAKQHILPGLRPVIANKAERYLAGVGVDIVKNVKVESITPDAVEASEITGNKVLTLSDGSVLDADLYIPATGSTPNTSYIDESLLSIDGRVDTNAKTLRVDKAGPRVYAIGDVASYARPAIHNILEGVPVLCHNIKLDLLRASGGMESGNLGTDRLFREDTRETQLVPIGRSRGVGAFMGYQVPSFLVWLIKGRDYWLWMIGGVWSGKQWAKEK